MFINIFNNKKFFLIFIFIVFLVLRISGLHLPYYQDERIWSGIDSSIVRGLEGIPHPPLTPITFILGVNLLGRDNLRYIPLLFASINFFLLFFLVRNRFSWNTAIWSVLFFSAVFYSVLASLMVDTDGQILPFFFLLSAISYYKWQNATASKSRALWGCAMVLSLVAGCLVKLSFVIVIGTIAADFVYSKKDLLSRKALTRYIGLLAVLMFSIGLIVFSLQYIFPAFNLSRSFTHWKPFFTLFDRNYLQVCIQFLKSILYISPLLLAPLIFLTKESAKKLRLFVIFIIFGLIFYLVLFDFSSGALDRYLQFMIVPLSVIAGVIISNIFKFDDIYSRKKFIVWGLLSSVAFFMVQFLPHFVPALYPKTEWFNRVLGLKWNFLFPFTGGSGPMGFYVSWLFIASVWLAMFILAIIALKKANWLKQAWIIIFILGFAYNGVFIEEYLFGKINGSSPALLKNAVSFIENDQNIKKIISYNNIGNFELSEAGKFERRLYIAPKFESGYIDIINNFKGHYLVIDIPKLHPSSPYVKFFSSCATIYEEYSGNISAKIYDCKGIRFE